MRNEKAVDGFKERRTGIVMEVRNEKAVDGR